MSEFNRFFGNDPNFPGVPFTASTHIATIRDNLIAVRASLADERKRHGELELIDQSLDALEGLFSDLQAMAAGGWQ